jgi:hypothetical protein
MSYKTVNTTGTDGRLVILQELEKKFKLYRDSNKERAYFNLEVKIKGVKDPLRVRIDCRIILERFVQFIGSEVIYSGVKLGATRKEALNEELRRILYGDETLFIQSYDVGDAYVYGEHAVANHLEGKYNKPIFYSVKKIKFTQLEPLAQDKIESGWSKQVVDRYFYYYDGQLLIRKTGFKDLGNEERFKNGDVKAAFEYGIDFVDDQGQFYEAFPVNDPDNIRILLANYESKTGLTKLAVKEVFSEESSLYHSGFTYLEFMAYAQENKKNFEAPLPLPSVPLKVGDVTIYSNRIIGEPLPVFEPGSWVILTSRDEHDYVKTDTYGKVISQHGKTLEVLWEHDYKTGYKSTINYYQVEVVPDPTITLEKPKLVRYEHVQRDEVQVGFGWLLSYTPNFARVVPIQRREKDLQSLQRAFRGYDYRWDRADELKQKIEKHYGRSDFILLPVETITFPDVSVYPLIRKYLIEQREDAQSNILKHLLILLGVDETNIDYYHVRLLELLCFMPFVDLIEQLTAKMAGASRYYSYEIRQGFDKKHLENWIEFQRNIEGAPKASTLFEQVNLGEPFEVLPILKQINGFEEYQELITKAEKDQGSILGVLEKQDDGSICFLFKNHSSINPSAILEDAYSDDTPQNKMYYWIFQVLNSYAAVHSSYKTCDGEKS